jgi:CheY-like chemotaxis protein
MAQRTPAHRRRALIVEDEAFLAMSLAAYMRGLGFDTCDLAADGQQAVLKAMSNQPDIVLMDVNLEGGREGIEAARWLREVCDIPIVFVTAYTDRVTLQRIHNRCREPLSSQSRSIASALLGQSRKCASPGRCDDRGHVSTGGIINF